VRQISGREAALGNLKEISGISAAVMEILGGGAANFGQEGCVGKNEGNFGQATGRRGRGKMLGGGDGFFRAGGLRWEK